MACLATKESADKLSKREGCDGNSCVLDSMLTEFMEMTMQSNMKNLILVIGKFYSFMIHLKVQLRVKFKGSNLSENLTNFM